MITTAAQSASNHVGVVIEISLDGIDVHAVDLVVENPKTESTLIYKIKEKVIVGFFARDSEQYPRVDNEIKIIPLSAFNTEGVVLVGLSKNIPHYRLSITGIELVDESFNSRNILDLQVVDWRTGKDLKIDEIMFFMEKK